MLHNPFPPTHQADEHGLLAVGGALNARWLMAAYTQGIFPWFNQGEPILWWSPTPRMVFRPEAFHVSRSLHKTLRRQLMGSRSAWCIEVNQDFVDVMRGCAERAEGSWIHGTMIEAYHELFQRGGAFSLALRQRADRQIIGGLYGVRLGKMLFAESMFSRVTDASKCLLAVWMRFMAANGYPLMDAQVVSPHLQSLGAVTLPRAAFEQALTTLIAQPATPFPTELTWVTRLSRVG